MRRSALACIAVVVLLAACNRLPLPARLGGLTRTRVLSGHQAAKLLARMHGKDVAPTDTVVAEYGRNGRLRVWVARYRDGAEAQSTFRRMLAGIRQGTSPFSRPSEDRSVPGRWTSVGNSAHHVFWVTERSIYWLEGDPDLVFPAADELPLPTAGLLALAPAHPVDGRSLTADS